MIIRWAILRAFIGGTPIGIWRWRPRTQSQSRWDGYIHSCTKTYPALHTKGEKYNIAFFFPSPSWTGMVELSASCRDSGVDAGVSQCMEVRPQFPAARGPQDLDFCYSIQLDWGRDKSRPVLFSLFLFKCKLLISVLGHWRLTTYLKQKCQSLRWMSTYMCELTLLSSQNGWSLRPRR